MVMTPFGQIVILNGAPRSGKSSIAAIMQATFDAPWINLGVDAAVAMTPERYRPGIGLRPGGERPDLEPYVAAAYAALYDSIAAHSRAGLNVVADVGHHDRYATLCDLLPECARRLSGLPVLFVGVRCDLGEIMRRRALAPDRYVTAGAHDPIPEPVRRWQEAVHANKAYDIEVDTTATDSVACAAVIRDALAHPQAPTAFEHLAARARDLAMAVTPSDT